MDTHSFHLTKLIDGLDCGLLGCFYQCSFWRHPFTAEDPLVSKWCDATFLQIYSHEETNTSTSWMARLGVNFQKMLVHFWWSISFTCIIPPGSSSVWHVSRSPLKLPLSCKITTESNAPAVTSRCSGTGKTEVKWISNYIILSLFIHPYVVDNTII